MDTLNYIINKYNVDLNRKSPFELSISRWDGLPKLFKELGFKTIAEIGVAEGKYSAHLGKYGFKVYGIDKWKVSDGYGDFSQERLNAFYKEAKERTKIFDCKLIKKWSMDAVKDFEDNSLDCVWIDGNHAFEYVTEDIAQWSKKVKSGGIIAGHDFFRRMGRIKIHVKNVVQGWAYCYQIHPWFILNDGRHRRCWMWVKA